MDRETLSLPVANSQFYTAAVSSISNMLSPIAQTPVDTENKDIMSNFPTSISAPSTSSILTTPNTPVFELTEEVRLNLLENNHRSCFLQICHHFQLTPKRPLRSEAEKEKRLSRTQSIVANCSTSSKIDNASVSGDSSNSRNSISKFSYTKKKIKNCAVNHKTFLVTTDSQTSEEDSLPPPLPVKHRDSENVNLMDNNTQHMANKSIGGLDECYQTVSRPFPVANRTDYASNTHYEVFDIKSRENESKAVKKNPPTPPPKPTRGSSKGSLSP